ncbi:MAG: hypothetical protein ACJ8KU_11495 [Chthoniobacterales bacterium]
MAVTLTVIAHYITIGNMSLIRGLFWLVLFVFFTFCFVVLFEYGTHDFTNGFKTELAKVKTFAEQAVKPSKDKPKR